MKRVKDFISVSDGLFSTMQNIEEEKYTNLFDDIEPVSLDCDFYTMSSERYASPLLNNSDIKTVVEVILNHYYNNWLKIKNSLLEDYDPAEPYVKVTEREITEKQKNKTGSENVVNDSIYAFNSEEDSPKDKTLTDNKEHGKINNKQLYKETIKGANGNTSQAEMIEKELQLRRISFITFVLNDTKELITLSIY